MKLTTFIMLISLFFVILFSAYLDSPYSFINKDYSYMTYEPAVAQPVDVEPSSDLPVFEDKLESYKKGDGYYEETYQEYEVFYDKDGHVIKRIPTSKTETLKYWDYKNNDR